MPVGVYFNGDDKSTEIILYFTARGCIFVQYIPTGKLHALCMQIYVWKKLLCLILFITYMDI